MSLVVVFFFFQAEDGIRDLTVTGVQTCALPISAVFQVPAPPRLIFPSLSDRYHCLRSAIHPRHDGEHDETDDLCAFPEPRGAGGVQQSLFAHQRHEAQERRDRKSTRLNSSHSQISYAVFCLKKKNKNTNYVPPQDQRTQ